MDDSDSHGYKELFEEWELKIARFIIRDFQRKFRSLAKEDFEDLLQTVLLRWVIAKRQYTASREASLKTFMKRVTENKLLDIVKEKETNKRKMLYKCVSLDELLNNKDSGFIEKFMSVDDPGFVSILNSDLSLLITKTINNLSLRQKELCRLLKDEGLNIKEASEKLNIPRPTLYEEIKRIREIFRSEGLEDYLK